MKTTKTIKRILAASDLSEHADFAIYRGAMLAAQHKAQLFLFHVIDDEIVDQNLLKLMQKGTYAVVDKLSKDAETTLREQAALLADKHFFSYSVDVEEGTDFISIINQARDDQADLIVLGAHGKNFFRDVFLGSTAEKVSRDSDLPVLVVKNTPTDAYARLLVTVDFSETSRQMLAFAMSLAPDAEIFVLHAYQRQAPKDKEGIAIFDPSEDYEGFLAQLENHAKAQLDQFLDEFDIGSRHVERIIECGYPPNVIRKVAEQKQADLTLVGANIHSDLQHFVLGDTADHALRELPCDVLVVRCPPPVLNSTESEQD